VFRPWIEDNAKTRKNCCACDAEFWKLSRFIDNESIVKQTEKAISNNYEFLKSIYASLQCTEKYPGVGLPEYLLFCENAKIMDAKLTQQAI
jgi:hypothetical protein